MSEQHLNKITDHVYIMPPADPDRPSLGAVVGAEHTLMLDSGASAAHARLFLDQLRALDIAPPRYVALTHWHWDHVFGAAEINAPLIAHTLTADKLMILKSYDWSDAALDARVLTGEEIVMCAHDIKIELPEPRAVEIALPDIVFEDTLELRLGNVTCRIEHVGGDHAADSCVMFIEPDRVLFLGDCLTDAIYTPVRHFTIEKLMPLVDRLLQFDADYIVEGHNTVMSRADFKTLMDTMRDAARMVSEVGTGVLQVMANSHAPADEELLEITSALVAGLRLKKDGQI